MSKSSTTATTLEDAKEALLRLEDPGDYTDDEEEPFSTKDGWEWNGVPLSPESTETSESLTVTSTPTPTPAPTPAPTLTLSPSPASSPTPFPEPPAGGAVEGPSKVRQKQQRKLLVAHRKMILDLINELLSPTPGKTARYRREIVYYTKHCLSNGWSGGVHDGGLVFWRDCQKLSTFEEMASELGVPVGPVPKNKGKSQKKIAENKARAKVRVEKKALKKARAEAQAEKSKKGKTLKVSPPEVSPLPENYQSLKCVRQTTANSEMVIPQEKTVPVPPEHEHTCMHAVPKHEHTCMHAVPKYEHTCMHAVPKYEHTCMHAVPKHEHTCMHKRKRKPKHKHSATGKVTDRHAVPSVNGKHYPRLGQTKDKRKKSWPRNGKTKWVKSAKAKGTAKGTAKGKAKGNAKGTAKGKAKGKAKGNAKGNGPSSEDDPKNAPEG